MSPSLNPGNQKSRPDHAASLSSKSIIQTGKSTFTDIRLDVVAAHAGNAEAGRRSGVADEDNGVIASFPLVTLANIVEAIAPACLKYFMDVKDFAVIKALSQLASCVKELNKASKRSQEIESKEY